MVCTHRINQIGLNLAGVNMFKLAILVQFLRTVVETYHIDHSASDCYVSPTIKYVD